MVTPEPMFALRVQYARILSQSGSKKFHWLQLSDDTKGLGLALDNHLLHININ